MKCAQFKLNIISYNVNGLENKYIFPAFFQYIVKQHVFVLIETHLTEEKINQAKKYFPDHDTFWKPASRSSKFGRASGGCVYGVSKELQKKGIKCSFKTENGIDVIRFHEKGNNITFIPLYIRGAAWHEEAEVVKEFFKETPEKIAVVMGDLNVRIGNTQQEIEDMYITTFKADIGKRTSRDEVLNNKGKHFLEFCNDYGLIILNGRTVGDEEGNFTFISAVGNSVNDICAVSHEGLRYVERFEIESKVWSDHMPIKLTLNIDRAPNEMESISLLPKVILKEKDVSKYQLNLNKNLIKLANRGEMINLEKLGSVIKMSVPKTTAKNTKAVFKSAWFNMRCLNARELSFKYLNDLRKYNKTDDKQKYLQAKQLFRNTCEKAKKDYYEELEKRINKTANSKEWWSLAKEIRGESFKVGVDITTSEFKNYFQDLLNQPQLTKDIHYAAALHTDTVLDKDVTIIEVQQIIKNAKTNKAPGEDRIPYELLKAASTEFIMELTKVYNIIFETGRIDEALFKTIVFPIFKKGNANIASNYRGISFMNCIAKVLMGLINERLTNWIENINMLTEFQAGFRKNYSTVDNIYNLASIVHLKFNENKKVYAYFVDFKAAFDRVPRRPLIYKLRQMGLSNKITNLIENIYSNTRTAVWTGREVSDYFETGTGVKQGCPLSPLLFTLYLNDLHDCLKGGLLIDGINVRLLLYADDIVLLADNPNVMQSMIKKLEIYCTEWNMEVNLMKSEMMVFRKGGQLAKAEKWWYKGEEIKVVAEYKYLGVILTSKMTFAKHVQARNNSAKASINSTWNNFLAKPYISYKAKWKLFQAVCRAIQTYAAQIWGYTLFEEVNKLQRYFIKRIFKLPDFTPNYAITLETNVEDSYLYSLELHMKYIWKTIYKYNSSRLPHKLTQCILRKNVFWLKQLNDLGMEFGLKLEENITATDWQDRCIQLLSNIKLQNLNMAKQKALSSTTRIYKHLDHSKGESYFREDMRLADITTIFKARCGLLKLNAIAYGNAVKICTLCNSNEEEDMYHFLGRCPVLKEIRQRYLNAEKLNDAEVIYILNGQNWRTLTGFIYSAWHYRDFLIAEFNY